MYNIYKYCSSLLIVCCVVTVLSAQENEVVNDSTKEKLYLTAYGSIWMFHLYSPPF